MLLFEPSCAKPGSPVHWLCLPHSLNKLIVNKGDIALLRALLRVVEGLKSVALCLRGMNGESRVVKPLIYMAMTLLTMASINIDPVEFF